MPTVYATNFNPQITFMVGMLRQRLEHPNIFCVLGLPKHDSLTHGLVETTKVFGRSSPQSSVEIVIVKIGDIRPWAVATQNIFFVENF